jgi:hypothetical protein
VTQPDTVTTIDQIPGWFPVVDQQVFAHFLGDGAAVPGDLVELGVYLGKTAALMGQYLRPGETFTVCDLFGLEPDDGANSAENRKSYRGVDRARFERYYLCLHDELPVVVQDLTSRILEHVAPATARFVHVDASHLYDQVALDVESARTMLKPQGVVAFDDYRSAHTPGVAAAVWEAVADGRLHPICVTGRKLYGTFGDPAPHREALQAWLRTVPGELAHEIQDIGGRSVVRVHQPRNPARTPPPQVAALRARVRELEAEVARLRARTVRRRARRLLGRARRLLRSTGARRTTPAD